MFIRSNSRWSVTSATVRPEKRIVNSSPPTRKGSPPPLTRASREATDRSTWSPVSWPKVSLMRLK